MITPALPHPYKRVKVVSGDGFVDEKGERVKGQYAIYMDPRGSVSFVIALPVYVGGQFGAERAGELFLVRSQTTNDVIAMARKAFATFRDKWAKAHRREVIVYNFDGIAPRFNERGMFVGRWDYKPPHTEYGGDSGSRISIEFYFERVWEIGDQYFYERSNGSFDRCHRGGESIPYSDAVWDQLVTIRETLTRAIVMLGRVFDSKDMPARLLALGTPQSMLLEAPPITKHNKKAPCPGSGMPTVSLGDDAACPACSKLLLVPIGRASPRHKAAIE